MNNKSRSIIIQSTDISEKVKEIDQILEDRETILFEMKQSLCCYQMKNKKKLKEKNNQCDQALNDLGKIVYKNSKAKSAQVNHI